MRSQWVRRAWKRTLMVQTFKMVNFKSTTRIFSSKHETPSLPIAVFVVHAMECGSARVIVPMHTFTWLAMRAVSTMRNSMHWTTHGDGSGKRLIVLCCYRFPQNGFCHRLISHGTSRGVHFRSIWLIRHSVHLWFRHINLNVTLKTGTDAFPHRMRWTNTMCRRQAKSIRLNLFFRIRYAIRNWDKRHQSLRF